MPNPIPQILPLIIRLFPALRTLPIARGIAIPLNEMQGLTDPELARKLSPKTKIKNTPNFNDATHVIKCSDVKSCIEKQFNNTTLILETVKRFCKQLVGGEGTAGQDLAQKIMDCVREDCLRSDTPRTTEPPRQKYHRPARGHGFGRGKF